MMTMRVVRRCGLAATVLFASMGCTKPEVKDTDIIRGPGVPTAPDDTLGTRYGHHDGPRRILPAPGCLPEGFALCVRDTARTIYTFRGDTEGGINDQRLTRWLVFAAAGDSLQVFIVGALESYLSMSPRSAAGFTKEHAINDASWIRARFAHRGTYVFTASITSDTVIPYELRVASVLTTGASHPTGKAATVIIDADSSTQVAIAPAAMARAIASDSAWQPFVVRPGSYRVLLVRDTAYVACQVPCRNRQQVALFPGRSATVRP